MTQNKKEDLREILSAMQRENPNRQFHQVSAKAIAKRIGCRDYQVSSMLERLADIDLNDGMWFHYIELGDLIEIEFFN